jgi:hypothetical protein
MANRHFTVREQDFDSTAGLLPCLSKISIRPGPLAMPGQDFDSTAALLPCLSKMSMGPCPSTSWFCTIGEIDIWLSHHKNPN